MSYSPCHALIGEIISFECRQEVYPTILKRRKAEDKLKNISEKNKINLDEILIYQYQTKGTFCDSVNCVIEKSTQSVKK